MVRPFPPTLLDFQRMFPDQRACGNYLERVRWFCRIKHFSHYIVGHGGGVAPRSGFVQPPHRHRPLRGGSCGTLAVISRPHDLPCTVAGGSPIRVDNAVIEYFRSQVERAGAGNYQTLMNDALLSFMQQRSVIDAVRLVVREEMSAPRAKPRQARARSVAA